MAGDFKVVVGVEVEDSQLDALQRKIDGIKSNPIKIKLDTSSAQTQLNNLLKGVGGKGNKSIQTFKIDADTSQVQRAGIFIKKSIGELQRYDNKHIRINADTSGVTPVLSSIEKQMKRLDRLKIDIDTNQLAATYNELKSTLREISSLEKKIGKPNIGSNELKTYESQLKTLTNTYNALRDRLRENIAPAQANELNSVIEKTDRELMQLGSRIVDTKNKLRDGLKLKFDDKSFAATMAKSSAAYDKLVDNMKHVSLPTDKLESTMKNLNAAYRELESAFNNSVNSGDIKPAIDAYEKWQNAVKQLGNEMSIAQVEQKKLLSGKKQQIRDEKLEGDKRLFDLDLQKWEKDNSAAVEQFGEKINTMRQLLQTADRVTFDNLKQEFKVLDRQADIAGKKGLNFPDRLRAQLTKFSSYFSIASVFYAGTEAARAMFQAVLDVDTAMTELKRVTDLSEAQYSNLYDGMVESAKKYGVALNDMISATADWSRAGFDASTAKGLAEVTTMYQHIADVDYDTAVQNLLTAYKGFEGQLKGVFGQDTVAAVGYIGDILNELDNNYSVTAAGIGEALKRSASALDVAGNSIQETAAMVTGITEVTQDPEKSGNALKVLSMRLRGMKGGLEEMGEEVDDNVQNLSKMQGQVLNLTHGKVNIFDDVGEFKSTYEIMQGIADVWEDLNSIEQADLLETIAGKHRANDVAALIQNWDNVEDAVVSATNATGSAATEHEKYVDSIQGRLNSLQSAWQAFSNSFLDSGFLKGGITALTKIVDIFSELIDNFGLLGTIGAGASIFGIARNGNQILNFFSNLTSAIEGPRQSLKGLWGSLSGFSKGAIGIGAAVAAISLLVNHLNKLDEEARKARQATIDESNKFIDSFGSFEQAYIKYADKTVLTVDEENELKAAIDGTVNALGIKASALRNAIGASSDYVSSLDEIAKAEAKQAADTSKEALAAAKGQLKADLEGGWFDKLVRGADISDKTSSMIDFELPEVNTKEYKAIKELIDDPEFQKYTKKHTTGNIQTGQQEDWTTFHFDPNASIDVLMEQYGYLQQMKEEMLQNLNADELENSDSYKKLSESIDLVSSSMAEVTKQTYLNEKANYQAKNGMATTQEEFYKMRESILSSLPESVKMRSEVANLMNDEYKDIFDLSSIESQIDLIKNVTGKDNNEVAHFETFLDLKAKVNNGECDVGDYMSAMSDVENIIKNADPETQQFLTTTLGIEFDVDEGKIKDEITELRDNFVKNVTKNSNIGEDVAKSIADDLSKSELEAAIQLMAEGEIDISKIDTDEVRRKIAERAKLNEALSFQINIEAETENIEKVNAAMAESVSGAGLTTESIKKVEDMFSNLDSYDPSKLFERTANGMRLNSDELRRMNDEYANTNAVGLQDKLSALGDEYLNTQEKLAGLTYGTDEYNTTAKDLSSLEAQIKETEQLAAQYEGLTSAYNQWQAAESAGNQRDMYESIISGFENVENELSRGWVDDGTIEFIELLSGEDLSSGNIDKIRSAWEGLDKTIKDTSYSVKDFFTTNEEGESTSDGVYNFLDAIGQLEEEKFGGKDVVQRDGNGNIIGFDFKTVGGDKVIADALGISEELVQIMVRAADDAGFVVSMDGTYQQLDVVREKAQLAAESLKTMGKTDVDFDFNSTDVDDLNKQLEEANKVWDQFKNNKKEDGTIDMSVEGAEEAFTVVSTLTTLIDQATQPAYMDIKADQVNKELQEPLSKLQKFEELSQQEHQLNIKGADTSELKKSKAEIVDYFENLDVETKMKLGIDGLSKEEIESKLDAGEIEIPATLDIQMEMNDNLSILAQKALLDSNIIDEEEYKKRVDVILEANVDGSEAEKTIQEQTNAILEGSGKGSQSAKKFIGGNEAYEGLDDSQKLSVVKFVADTSEIDSYEAPEDKTAIVNFIKDIEDVENYTPEQKNAIAKYVKDISDIESYSPEAKQAVCDFIVNNSDVMAYTPENKAAIAKYIADPSALESFEPEDKEAVAKFIAEHGEVDSWNPEDREAIAKYLLNVAEVEGYTPPPAEGTVTMSPDTTNMGDNFTGNGTATMNPNTTNMGGGFTGTGVATMGPNTTYMGGNFSGDGKTVMKPLTTYMGNDFDGDGIVDVAPNTYNLGGGFFGSGVISVVANFVGAAAKFLTGGGGVDGTAHVDGTAFADGTTARKSGKAFKQGSWGTKKNGVALGGELGTELLVRDGRWYTIGEDGAEFFGYKKGDIIFNADQTREIFKKGKITHGSGRGKALVDGTAFAGGSSGSGGWGRPSSGSYHGSSSSGSSGGSSGGSGSSSSRSSSNSSNSNSSSKSNEEAEEFEETLDWIEIKIDRIERAISRLDLKASSVFRSWGERNQALIDQMGQVRAEMDIQQAGYDRYLQQANSVGLDEWYASKVRDGTIDIETITDEDLNDKVQKYQEWYEKALDCSDAIEELNENLSELYRQRFDNVVTEYDGILGVIEHEKNMLDEYINQTELHGYIVSTEYYQALKSNEQRNLDQLRQERDSLLATLSDAVDSGTIKKYSQDWDEMMEKINGITLALEEGKSALQEYDNAIREIEWSIFDLLQEQISQITQEADFLIDVMSNKKLYDDRGQLTDEGMSTMGLHGVNYNVYMAQADKYKQEMLKISKQLAKDPYNQDLVKRRQELIKLQQESILSAEDEKNAIKDMVEEGIELELDALQELIDKREEALDAEKDLYDYQRKVKEQTKEIAALEKEMSAYAGDDSEEAKQKIQKIKVDLEEAKADLEESEYDKYISDQKQLLDDLYLEYETVLNARLDNIDMLISDMITEINNNAGTISSTLYEVADNVGYTLSDSMQTIWSVNTAQITGVLSMYGDNFLGYKTTVNAALNTINAHLLSMVTTLNSIALAKSQAAALEAVSQASDRAAAAISSANISKPAPAPAPAPAAKQITVGGQINAGNARIYATSQGTGGGTQYYRNDPIYTVLRELNGYLLVRYHKLSSGYTGWFKKSDVKAYATGKKKILEDEVAWTQENGSEMIVRPSDGAVLTPLAKNDSVLSSSASNNIWDMANNPTDFIKDNLGIDKVDTPVGRVNNATYTQNLDKVVFNLPNVKNYSELLSEMQRDKNFERLILSMTIDQIAGKTSLGKGKAIR